MLDLAVATPTLVGSIESMLASGFIFLCYLILPPQFGTDSSILFITIATVINLKRWNYHRESKPKTKIMVSCSIWLVSLATSTTALGLEVYKPVSSNWCWISPTPIYLHYALGHGWRLTIILITISLYIYLFVYIHRHFSSLREVSTLNGSTDHVLLPTQQSSSSLDKDETNIYIPNDFEVYEEHTYLYWELEEPQHNETYFNFPSPAGIPRRDSPKSHLDHAPPSPLQAIKETIHPNALTLSSPSALKTQTSPLLSRDTLALIRRPPPSTFNTTAAPLVPPSTVLKSREWHVQKLFLFNAYPVGYVLLWIPGIVNRVVELGGGSSRVLAIALASTQFVGLVNVVVYGYKEHNWGLAKLWYRSKKKLRKRKESQALTKEAEKTGKVYSHTEYQRPYVP